MHLNSEYFKPLEIMNNYKVLKTLRKKRKDFADEKNIF